MTPVVRTEDLVDVHEVAEILGLAQRNSVSTYLRRYPDMPRPVLERSQGRTRLWLRGEIEGWGRQRHHEATRSIESARPELGGADAGGA